MIFRHSHHKNGLSERLLPKIGSCERALILLTWYTYPGIPWDTCSHSIQSVDELWSDDLDKMLTIRYEVGNAVKPDSVLMYNNVDPLHFLTVIFSAIQIIIHRDFFSHSSYNSHSKSAAFQHWKR